MRPDGELVSGTVTHSFISAGSCPAFNLFLLFSRSSCPACVGPVPRLIRMDLISLFCIDPAAFSFLISAKATKNERWVCAHVCVRGGGGYWSRKRVGGPQAASRTEMRKEGRRGSAGHQGSVGRPGEMGRCRCLAAFRGAGVWHACVRVRWCEGNASQQNVEISTDTTQIEKNHFDKGPQMITTLETLLQTTTPAQLQLL